MVDCCAGSKVGGLHLKNIKINPLCCLGMFGNNINRFINMFFYIFPGHVNGGKISDSINDTNRQI